MINWNKYFDHIFVLSKTSNFDRRELINKEFYRVGIHNYDFWYSCDNNLIKSLPNKVLCEKHQNLSFGHYSLIKTCYELGYENILICEDDICFLKDIENIKICLDTFYQLNPDIYLFDWYDYSEYQYMYQDCYYLNRKGMEYLIYLNENYYQYVASDSFWLKDLNTNNSIFMTYSMYNKSNQLENICIHIPENILPIKLLVSELRLCTQKFDPFIAPDLDESLYNKL